jgi:hypothetical protein
MRRVGGNACTKRRPVGLGPPGVWITDGNSYFLPLATVTGVTAA